jgi:hypothetical protein
MDADELSVSIAEALEQYLGIEEISIEDERTIVIEVEGDRWQIKLKPLTKISEGVDDEDEDSEEGADE